MFAGGRQLVATDYRSKSLCRGTSAEYPGFWNLRDARDLRHSPARPARSEDWLLDSVSVRQLHEGLQSLRSMRRMEARRRNASALGLRFSQSRARRRHRLSHAMVRSTIQRLGSTTKPLACLLRLTISTARLGIALAAPVWKIGPA